VICRLGPPEPFNREIPVGDFATDHRGVVGNFPWGALARLGLARAYALQARSAQGRGADAARAKAGTAYLDFLVLWKDADSGVPILKQAKAEYASD